VDVVSSWTIWNARVKRLTFQTCVFLVLCATTTALAEPLLMTDADLDKVAARGVTDEEGNNPVGGKGGGVLDLNGLLATANPDGTGALFSIDTASLFGSGGIDIAGLTEQAGFTLNGDLSNAVFNVGQLSVIINMNMCIQCKADAIYQTGLGLVGIPVPIIITPLNDPGTP